MNASRRKLMSIALLSATVFSLAIPTAEAAFAAYRQRYSSWSYYPARSYYYRTYYYKPAVSYSSYNHHYCVYYTSRPSYVYYYNPVRRVYWGRYDLKAGGYSMLEEKDRSGDLESIPESAFPAPGEMPVIPDSEDGERIERPDPNDLPTADAPNDVPGTEPKS
jgi:hypothetical protein